MSRGERGGAVAGVVVSEGLGGFFFDDQAAIRAGAVADGDVGRCAEILQRLERAAAPHRLRVEHPIHASAREEQIAALGELRALLRSRGATVQLVAGEWANTAGDIHRFAVAGAADLVQIKTPTSARSTTPSTRSSTAGRTASARCSAAAARRPSSPRAPPPISASPPA